VSHAEDDFSFDGFWVDYLENEIDEKLMPDLQKLLKLSEESRKTLKSLHWVRELIETADPAHEEHLKKWDENKSFNKIMEACGELEDFSENRVSQL